MLFSLKGITHCRSNKYQEIMTNTKQHTHFDSQNIRYKIAKPCNNMSMSNAVGF